MVVEGEVIYFLAASFCFNKCVKMKRMIVAFYNLVAHMNPNLSAK